MTLVASVCAPLGLTPEAVAERIAAGTAATVELRFEPSLLPPQRFPADHRGSPDFHREPAAQRRWESMLADSDVVLGVPGDDSAGVLQLVRLAPVLRWLQGTAAGTGEQVAGARLPSDVLERVQFTSAAGLHAVPLAEFAVFGLLAFAKDADVLSRIGAAREWPPRWPMRLLRGSRVLVLGLGGVGQEVARLCAGLGCQVTGVRRRAGSTPPPGVQEVIGLDELDERLPHSDAVVITLPGTAQTANLFDHARLARLPRHAVLVNVGRGSVVDSAALAGRLDEGALRGAVVDVTDQEPLPPESPLWGRPNVLISPHTAALTVDEDERIVDLFADNLGRLVDGRPLRNPVDHANGY